jgi:hypothetical protein
MLIYQNRNVRYWEILKTKSFTVVFRYKGLDIFKRPQCLIETDKDGFLTIVKKTAEEMQQITSPVNVVAIAGLYRTGKSYLMNRLAGETAGNFIRLNQA